MQPKKECEVDQYLAGPLVDLKTNPFKWWESYHYRYPVLGRLVKKYLSAPPTSVNSERVFSDAGELYSDRRTRLLPELAEKLLVIKYNFPLVGDIQILIITKFLCPLNVTDVDLLAK